MIEPVIIINCGIVVIVLIKQVIIAFLQYKQNKQIIKMKKDLNDINFNIKKLSPPTSEDNIIEEIQEGFKNS